MRNICFKTCGYLPTTSSNCGNISSGGKDFVASFILSGDIDGDGVLEVILVDLHANIMVIKDGVVPVGPFSLGEEKAGGKALVSAEVFKFVENMKMQIPPSNSLNISTSDNGPSAQAQHTQNVEANHISSDSGHGPRHSRSNSQSRSRSNSASSSSSIGSASSISRSHHSMTSARGSTVGGGGTNSGVIDGGSFAKTAKDHIVLLYADGTVQVVSISPNEEQKTAIVAKLTSDHFLSNCNCLSVLQTPEPFNESLILVGGGSKIKLLRYELNIQLIVFVGSFELGGSRIHSMDTMLGRFILATSKSGEIYAYSLNILQSSGDPAVVDDVSSSHHVVSPNRSRASSSGSISDVNAHKYDIKRIRMAIDSGPPMPMYTSFIGPAVICGTQISGDYMDDEDDGNVKLLFAAAWVDGRIMVCEIEDIRSEEHGGPKPLTKVRSDGFMRACPTGLIYTKERSVDLAKMAFDVQALNSRINVDEESFLPTEPEIYVEDSQYIQWKIVSSFQTRDTLFSLKFMHLGDRNSLSSSASFFVACAWTGYTYIISTDCMKEECINRTGGRTAFPLPIYCFESRSISRNYRAIQGFGIGEIRPAAVNDIGRLMRSRKVGNFGAYEDVDIQRKYVDLEDTSDKTNLADLSLNNSEHTMDSYSGVNKIGDSKADIATTASDVQDKSQETSSVPKGAQNVPGIVTTHEAQTLGVDENYREHDGDLYDKQVHQGLPDDEATAASGKTKAIGTQEVCLLLLTTTGEVLCVPDVNKELREFGSSSFCIVKKKSSSPSE